MRSIKRNGTRSVKADELYRDDPNFSPPDNSFEERGLHFPHSSANTKVESLKESITTREIFIDAGIEHIHLRTYDSFPENNSETLTNEIIIKNNDDIRKLFRDSGIIELFDNDRISFGSGNAAIYITGKLSGITQKVLRQGESIMPAAALWAAAKSLFHREENKELETIGIIDLSASGYMVICVGRNGELKDDLLIVNPRCGAGTGVNLSRILEKLDIRQEAVDLLLIDYLGAKGKANREQIPVRSDRCGVFSSSATVSDKNQGIPLDYALAVTMKSEVLKPCTKMSSGTDKVYLTGGVFRWQYARECAEDFLRKNGVKQIVCDEDQSIMLNGMKYLVKRVGNDNFRRQNSVQLRRPDTLLELPSFKVLKEDYEKNGIYERLPDPEIEVPSPQIFVNLPVNVGLDIGSTMAKIIVTDAGNGKPLFQNSYNNHGDTIETIKHIFRKLKSNHIDKLNIQNIGITGSGRYQVQKALKAIYPHIQDRIFVLVENYAHARGSLQYAKDHIAKLKRQGNADVNEDFYLLVDIGGEDTKISVVSLKKEELFDNAMNIKCSAGTGSLMDTLKALFNIEDIAEAYGKAFKAAKAYGINATCAVFLMENARKMQAEGYNTDEILASCCYAIVENMARTLWNQVEFPENTIILLHGQTMLSDPLPLAVTQRAQEFMGTKTYCLVPPFPGHQACIGLVKSIEDRALPEVRDDCYLDALLERKFDKKIIVCRGAACGDKNARCARTKLSSENEYGRISLTLGGCTAVNELQARQKNGGKMEIPETYKEIWNFIDSRLPKSEDENKLVIPRSFAVSEKAFFLGKLFERFGIPVHVDNVRESDVMEGQPLFAIDTCAPNIGAAGQFLRLARNPHGIILVPQIDFLPTDGMSLGRTCTTNQGGVLIAHNFAQMKSPQARFKVFNLSLDKIDAPYIADQLYSEFQSIFEIYGVNVSKSEFIDVIEYAKREDEKLRHTTAEKAANFIEEAIAKKLNISIVFAREYILNPGIYDSHIGKLLKDKGVFAIPSYVFDTSLDNQFGYIYWRNPHDILTKVNAITNKQFHRIVKHPRLRELIKRIETGLTDTMLSVVTVSTFRCGPDSITLPTVTEITKNIPSLLIQSDAMITELAHLENRVNTHLNQLQKSLHNELSRKRRTDFSIEILDNFILDGLNKQTDVLYFPTMGDNRILTSVFRGAGLTVIDNYEDDVYNLEARGKMGRKHVGDAVCAPLAVVFADMLHAIDDFIHRKKLNDPLVHGKERIVLFMVGGDGPCRLGQYVDVIKLYFYRMFGNHNAHAPDQGNGQHSLKILENVSSALLGKDYYNAALERWTAIQSFQAAIFHGLLYSLYLKAGSNCKNHAEFEEMVRDYRQMKRTIYHRIEHEIRPSRFTRLLVDQIGTKLPKLAGPVQYFGYGLFNSNGFRKILREFSEKWIDSRTNGADSTLKKTRIHVDGEIYLRVAQVDEIFKSLIDALGYGTFELTCTPGWCFFENVLTERILIVKRDIETHEEALKHIDDRHEKDRLMNLIEEKKSAIKETEKTIHNLRNVLARPLYKAASLEIPHEMEKVFAAAEPVIPTYKPFGELVPYVGETTLQINDGVDLVLNVAPEGCMVSSMGEILTPKILQSANNGKARIQYLFSTEGEINEELLRLSLLKTLGPEEYYSR